MRILKSVERGWKNAVFGLIRLYLRLRPSKPVADWTSGPRRILFLRQDRLGDAIISTGLLRAIASISPEIELDVLASPRNAPLIRRLPYVREVLLFDKRRPGSFLGLWRRLRQGRYDAVIDCMITSRSMTGLLLMLASGAPHRMGIGGRAVDWGLTVRAPLTDGHIIELLSIFIEAFGVDRHSVDWRPELPLTAEELASAERTWEGSSARANPRLLVNVSAGEPRRAWPDDRYVAVVRALRTSRPELEIRMVGAPGEWERTVTIAGASGVAAVATPAIESVIALVATADFVFTPDTSIVHMASAFAKPAVAMFIKDTASQWGLYGTPGVNLESAGMTLDDLEVATVLDALATVIPLDERD